MARFLICDYCPEDACGLARHGASLIQLRKRQLQQLATIIQEADASCAADDNIALSNALEKRALPWLERLHELVCLWEETLAAAARLGIKNIPA